MKRLSWAIVASIEFETLAPEQFVDDGPPKASPEHRRVRQDSLRERIQRVDLRRQRPLQRLRNRIQRAEFLSCRDQLTYEQRTAVGTGDDEIDLVRPQRRCFRCIDREGADDLVRQRTDGDRLAHLRDESTLVVAADCDQQPRMGSGRIGDSAQQMSRRVVCPVHVLGGDDQWAVVDRFDQFQHDIGRPFRAEARSDHVGFRRGRHGKLQGIADQREERFEVRCVG